jgi:hypothetical protein
MTQTADNILEQEVMTPTSPPVHKVRYGGVEVAIWRREGEGRTFLSFSVGRNFKNKDGQWQRTATLDEEDLLPAAKALEDAYSWSQSERVRTRDGVPTSATKVSIR